MNSKKARCKHAHLSFKDMRSTECTKDGFENDQIKKVEHDTCEACPYFESKFIEYPITVSSIENTKIKQTASSKIGKLCKIRPCAEEYNDKSYVGIYIGELPISIYTTYDEKSGVLSNGTMDNPAIFVPELKKIIYGCESYWSIIDDISEFKSITDEDIDGIWYVQLLKAMKEETHEK